jgi:hypothetical protein
LTVDSAADGYIRYFDIIKNGIYVGDDSGNYIINQQNNSKTLITNSNLGLVLENSNNDLIFQNGSILRFGSNSLISIVAADNSSGFNHQGNFSIFRSGSTSITKIYDTITLNNYTIQQCNGPRITALSSKFALINDCQVNPILDMISGARSGVNNNVFSIFTWNSANILVSDGGLGIGQSCGTSPSYGICHIDASTKNLTKIISGSVSPASSGKAILLSTKNYFFFIGEKSNGAIVSGKYDVITGSSVEFNISGTPVMIQGF